MFAYADGSSDFQTVARGAFERHWHVGGQIAFDSRARDPALKSVWLRFDRLESYDLLRVRLGPAKLAPRQFELAATLIGAALALLALAALYNLGLAIALRRWFFLWHGAWAAVMLCWGLVWSQCALVAFPGIAGTVASRLSTVLACLAILFATASATNALRATLSARVRWLMLGAALSVVALGLGAILPRADLGAIGVALAVLTLGILAVVTGGLVIGWRRGSDDARDLLFAWIVPMLVLASTQVIDFSTVLFGGGAQIAVLFASAAQTVSVSALATRRLGALKIERDIAIAAETVSAELADRDTLTGLLNRRGFVRRCEQAFGSLRHVPFGLLLIDVDHFKEINDRFGHEIGDRVLIDLGRKLLDLEPRYLCLAGRLGGEEFVVGVSGMAAFALEQFAGSVCEALRCGGGGADGLPEVSVSIGVAEGAGSGPFATLYGRADRALYEAKAAGRNRVVFKAHAIAEPDQQFQLPLA